jgi:hypothetical protein
MSASNDVEYTFYHVFVHRECGNGFLKEVFRPAEDIVNEPHRKHVIQRILGGALYRCFKTNTDEIAKLEKELECPKCKTRGVVFDPFPI